MIPFNFDARNVLHVSAGCALQDEEEDLLLDARPPTPASLPLTKVQSGSQFRGRSFIRVEPILGLHLL